MKVCLTAGPHLFRGCVDKPTRGAFFGERVVQQQATENERIPRQKPRFRLGAAYGRVPMDRASATMTMFLMMYWPSRLGTINICQTMCGNRTSGIQVVKTCNSRLAIATFSSRGITNMIPISISYEAKPIINLSSGIKGIVLSHNAVTRGPAGLTPRTFNKPNQKYTTNNAK